MATRHNPHTPPASRSSIAHPPLETSQAPHVPQHLQYPNQRAVAQETLPASHDQYSGSSKFPPPATHAAPTYEQQYGPYRPSPGQPFISGQEDPTAAVGHIIRHLREDSSQTTAESPSFQFVSGHKKYPEEMPVGQVRRTVKKIRQRRESGSAHTADHSIRPSALTYERPERVDAVQDSRTDGVSRRLKANPMGALPPADGNSSQSSSIQISKGVAVPVAQQPQPTFNTINYTPSNLTPKTPVPKMENVRSVPISDLISQAPRRSEPSYQLVIRQQPVAARACGFGERDRRVIDPPPILQMILEDPYASKDEIRNKLRDPYNVVHCSLYHADREESDSLMPETGERRQQRRLMGQLVSSPFYGLDENGKEGSFFCFPDLSCRTSGKYRLEFKLVIIDQESPRSRHPCPSVVISQVFQVFAAKDFPGMQESTPLTKKLKQQGCQISVKKGNAKKDAKGGDDGPIHHRAEYDDDDDDDDEDEDDEEEEEPADDDEEDNEAPPVKSKAKSRVAKGRMKRQRK